MFEAQEGVRKRTFRPSEEGVSFYHVLRPPTTGLMWLQLTS